MRDPNYFVNNSDPNKRFLGEPTYTFQGKEVSYLTRWSPKAQLLLKYLWTF